MGLGKFTSTAGGKIKPTETNCKIAFCPAGFIHGFQVGDYLKKSMTYQREIIHTDTRNQA